ncbi:MAG: hypothetical protein DMF61_03080 [Blastocatellia bacterium AA13]|nr:MAG: hypothetical protein DMF61_03080 [Blastocatellia bacterium AA13]
MNKILIIIQREYTQRVRGKAFLLSTLLMPLVMLVFTLAPILLVTKSGGERRVVVLDESGDPKLFDALKEATSDRLADTKYQLTREVIPPGADLAAVRKEWERRAIKDSDLAYLTLPPGVLDRTEPEYSAANISDFSIDALGRALSSAIVHRRLVRAGVEADKADQYTKSVEMKKNKVTEQGESREGGQTFMLGFVLLFFIYMTTLLYGISVMRGVMEEKQSRIVEIIVSSVRPFQMLLGKLIGIGLVGLTQYAVWVTFAVLLTFGGVHVFAGGRSINMPALPPGLLICFVTYFVLGYFLFATLYSIVGSMIASEEDAQQLMFPVTMLNVIPMVLFWTVVRNPNGGFAIGMSLFPFFAPTLMMMRIAIISPPVWQILLSMLLMVLSILGAVWIAARIYRVGILMYGKRPSLAELGRWIRYQ